MHDDATIKAWLKRIVGHEGGYSRDQNDPGNWTGGKVGVGELLGTKWGIAANTYGHLDIPNLTIDDAAAIYRRDFLTPIRAELFRDGVAFQLLDFAVNSGPRRALIEFQKAIGVKPDGIIGPITQARAESMPEGDIIKLILAQRIDFMRKLPNWRHHGNGWMGRIAENLRYGAMDS